MDEMTATSVDAPRFATTRRMRGRRRLRFSLLSLLVLLSAASLFLADFGHDYRMELRRGDRRVPTAFNVITGRNVLWQQKVGTQSYAGPVVANGKVFVGTNNGMGYIDRYPAAEDLGVLLCFDAANGGLLWQASTEPFKHKTIHLTPLQGICSTPVVEGDRLWYVTNRAELVCLDANGFRDGTDDGVAAPKDIALVENEADVVWRLDMIGELGVHPEHRVGSSPCVGEHKVFAVTGHGASAREAAPSFIAVNKESGELVWSDSSPSGNILHNQLGSPIYFEINGTPQVLFPGGDGWLYCFDPAGNSDGTGKLLWKFDCNPKDSEWILGGQGTRNNLMTAASVYRDRIFIAVGQDPELGEGNGHVWCIDPTKRGDVSPELVVHPDHPKQVVAHRRRKAIDDEAGEIVIPNPNSAEVWHFEWTDTNEDGTQDFDESMHRSLSRVVFYEDLAFVTDFSGLLHCLDVETGKQHWSYDQFAASWTSPVIGAEHVFVGDEDGDVAAFALSADAAIAMPANLPVSVSDASQSVHATPVIHRNVMYLLARSTLFAIKDATK